MSDGKIRLVSSGSRTYVRRWSNEQHAINMFKAVKKTKQKSLQHFHQASAQIHNELSLQYTSILLLALGELFIHCSIEAFDDNDPNPLALANPNFFDTTNQNFLRNVESATFQYVQFQAKAHLNKIERASGKIEWKLT